MRAGPGVDLRGSAAQGIENWSEAISEHLTAEESWLNLSGSAKSCLKKTHLRNRFQSPNGLDCADT
jgi:hypothetical protein